MPPNAATPTPPRLATWLESSPEQPRKSLRRPLVPDHELPRKDIQAAWLNIKVALLNTYHMYWSRNTLPEKTYDKVMEAVKMCISKSRAEYETRLWLGTSLDLWQDYAKTFERAQEELKTLTYLPNDPAEVGSSTSLAAYMVKHAQTLCKDLERLNDLMILSRNMLFTVREAQDYASDGSKFDKQVLNLLALCVKVSARGYDGESGSRTENFYAKIMNSFKTLLVTTLQWIHNLVKQNESRKVALWLDLFCNPDQDTFSRPTEPEPLEKEETTVDEPPPPEPKPDGQESGAYMKSPEDDWASDILEFLEYLGLNRYPTEEDGGKENVSALIHEFFKGLSAAQIYPLIRTRRPTVEDSTPKPPGEEAEPKKTCEGHDHHHPSKPSDEPFRPYKSIPEFFQFLGRDKTGQAIDTTPMKISKMPQLVLAAKQALASNIDVEFPELSKLALFEDSPEAEKTPPGKVPTTLHEMVAADRVGEGGDEELDESPGEEDDEYGDDDDDSEDADVDFSGPFHKSRVFLTDIPLVLGPSEIEALPLFILGCVTEPKIPDTMPKAQNSAAPKAEASISEEERKTLEREQKHRKLMQAVRCHILLTQNPGRQLMRELLIFVAAWDLPEDDFYFNILVHLVTAILDYGLFPHAYRSFAEIKEIVSPTQSILLKMLFFILRRRQTESQSQPLPCTNASHKTKESAASRASTSAHTLTPTEHFAIQFLLSTFRKDVLPPTLAIIWLQGQIRAGTAVTQDDFPMNLWDMERVYEGVYQFLEFFSCLNDAPQWKQLSVETHLAYDLVQLLAHLDEHIPKAPFIVPSAPAGPISTGPDQSLSSPSASTPPIATALAGESKIVEDAGAPASTVPPPPVPPPPPPPPPASATTTDVSSPPPTSGSQQQQRSRSTAGGGGGGGSGGGAATTTSPTSPPGSPQAPHLFAWRNLKKMCILVLSGLVYRTPRLKAELRSYGAVTLVLGCCAYDSHNPYVKEHAVLCLRFLLEGDLENQRLVQELEHKGSLAGLGGAASGNAAGSAPELGGGGAPTVAAAVAAAAVAASTGSADSADGGGTASSNNGGASSAAIAVVAAAAAAAAAAAGEPSTAASTSTLVSRELMGGAASWVARLDGLMGAAAAGAGPGKAASERVVDREAQTTAAEAAEDPKTAK